jgi:hypothetical protein
MSFRAKRGISVFFSPPLRRRFAVIFYFYRLRLITKALRRHRRG